MGIRFSSGDRVGTDAPLTSAPADAAQTAPPVPDFTSFRKTQGLG